MLPLLFAGWQAVSECSYVSESPVEVEVVRVLATEPASMTLWPPDQWNTVDLTTVDVPADAKVAMLGGLIKITHGAQPELGQMQVWFRRPGGQANPARLDVGYVWQIMADNVSAPQTNNVRHPVGTTVPLTDGKFEFWWWRQPPGVAGGIWPEWSSYSIRMRVLGWCR